MTHTDATDFQDAFQTAVQDLCLDKNCSYVVNYYEGKMTTAVIVIQGNMAIREILGAVDQVTKKWDRRAARSKG